MRIVLIVTIFLMCFSRSFPKQIICGSKPFVCYNKHKFYQCAIQSRQPNKLFYVRGSSAMNCPEGLYCNDKNDYECEEDISEEYLTDQKYFDSKGEGIKYIINES